MRGFKLDSTVNEPSEGVQRGCRRQSVEKCGVVSLAPETLSEHLKLLLDIMVDCEEQARILWSGEVN